MTVLGLPCLEQTFELWAWKNSRPRAYKIVEELLLEPDCSFPSFPDSQNNPTVTMLFKSLLGQSHKHIAN